MATKSKQLEEGVVRVEEIVSAAPEKRAPEEWMHVCGEELELNRLGFGGEKFGRVRRPSAKHAAADVLHGWARHAHHAGESIKLTRSDYEAALDASHPAEGAPVPHPPAVSPYRTAMI